MAKFQKEMSVPEDVLEAFKALKAKRRLKWIIVSFSSDKDSFDLEQAEGVKSKSLSDLVLELPTNEPRFIIYEHEYVTADKRPTDKLYFIMWSPAACAPVLNMAYTNARPNLRGLCEGCYDVAASSEEDLIHEIMTDTDPNYEKEEEAEDEDWMDV